MKTEIRRSFSNAIFETLKQNGDNKQLEIYKRNKHGSIKIKNMCITEENNETKTLNIDIIIYFVGIFMHSSIL